MIENSRRGKMGKKYLETKKDSLESSVLGVWQDAIKEGDSRMDGRTKQYKSHRAKLEAARLRREERKKLNREEVEFDEVELTEDEWEVFNEYMDMSDEEFETFLENADYETLTELGGFLKKAAGWAAKKAGSAVAKGAKYAVTRGTAKGRADAADKKLAKAKTKDADVKRRKDAKKALKNVGKEPAKEPEKKAAPATADKPDPDPKPDPKPDPDEKKKKQGQAMAAMSKKKESFDPRKFPDMREALMQVRAEKPVDLSEHKGDKPHKHPHPPVDEASGDKEAYQKFFNAALKKFKVDSPADFKSDEEKKKFYDYIDKNWEGDNEKAEQVREFKIQSMKAALAQIWGMEEGKNPFKKEDHEDKKIEKKNKTETGKRPAVIDLKPKIDDK